jgi:hypothetical protein
MLGNLSVVLLRVSATEVTGASPKEYDFIRLTPFSIWFIALVSWFLITLL